MSESYQLSLSNRIYYGLVTGFSIIIFFAVADYSPYSTGRLVGLIMFFLLIPMLVSWLFWKYSKDKKKSANYAFNIMLTLIVLGQISQFSQKTVKYQAMDDMQTAAKDFLIESSHPETQEDVEGAYQKFSASLSDNFDKLAQNGSRDEKIYYEMMGEAMMSFQAVEYSWIKSLGGTQTEEFWDLKVLKEEAELQSRVLKIDDLIEKSENYMQSFNSQYETLSKQIDELDISDGFKTGAKLGFKGVYDERKPPLNELINGHINYAKAVKKMMNWMHEYRNTWSFENEQIVFVDSQFEEEFFNIYDAVGELENNVNQLSMKYEILLASQLN